MTDLTEIYKAGAYIVGRFMGWNFMLAGITVYVWTIFVFSILVGIVWRIILLWIED